MPPLSAASPRSNVVRMNSALDDEVTTTHPPKPSEYESSNTLSRTVHLPAPSTINEPESFASPVPPRELEKRQSETVASALNTFRSAPPEMLLPMLPRNVFPVSVWVPKISHTAFPRLDVNVESRSSKCESKSASEKNTKSL